MALLSCRWRSSTLGSATAAAWSFTSGPTTAIGLSSLALLRRSTASSIGSRNNNVSSCCAYCTSLISLASSSSSTACDSHDKQTCQNRNRHYDFITTTASHPHKLLLSSNQLLLQSKQQQRTYLHTITASNHHNHRHRHHHPSFHSPASADHHHTNLLLNHLRGASILRNRLAMVTNGTPSSTTNDIGHHNATTTASVRYFFTDSDWRAKCTDPLFASGDSGGGSKPALKDKSLEDIRVRPKITKERKVDTTPTSTSIGRNFVTTTRAMREYALDISDLVDLRKFQRRSPYNNEPPITVYLRKDVEAKALSIWQTWDRLNAELQRRKTKEDSYSDSLSIVKKYNKDYRRLNTPQAKQREEIMRKSARVVMAAIFINGGNCLLKLLAWLYTGSHSLFAEAIHSLADTVNQIILAYGIRKSIQVPNKEHPYGYHPMRYIAALISGVGILCTGTGLSVYHGIHGLLHEAPVESFYWAFVILGGSFISEGATLVIALDAAKKAAISQNMSLKSYIKNGNDPTLNVVILEDFAAVVGVAIAGTCMGLTTWFNTGFYDAIGSLLIGGLLGAVASFVIVSNSGALVGQSIPQDRLSQINKLLESDSMVRAIHDVKATNMGNEMIRYKAEVDFDGRKLTRNYLDSIDLEQLFKEFQDVQTIEECEEFMLKHGENIVDLLGAEVDRIENNLKEKHPQVRHVDLEVL